MKKNNAESIGLNGNSKKLNTDQSDYIEQLNRQVNSEIHNSMDNLALSFVIIDNKGSIKSFNNKFLELTGLPKTSLSKKLFSDLLATSSKFYVLEKLTHINELKGSFEDILDFISADRSMISVTIYGNVVHINNSEDIEIHLLVKENNLNDLFVNKLIESETRFHTQYLSNPIPTFTWKKSQGAFVLVDWNYAAEKFTKGLANELQNIKSSDFFDSDPEINSDILDCFQHNVPVSRETKFYFKSLRKSKDLIITCAFCEPDMVMMHMEDITLRKQAEANVLESENRYRSVFDNINSGIEVYFHNKLKGFVLKDMNRSAEIITGVDRSQANDLELTVLKPGIENTSLLQILLQVNETGKSEEIPVSYYELPNLKGWFEFYVFKLSENVVVSVMDDVTARMNSEETLRINEERLTLALEGANEGLWDWNLQIDEIYYNEQWLKMLELPIDFNYKENKKFWEERIHKIDYITVISNLYSHLRGETSYYESEHRLQTATGNYIWVLDHGKVIQRDSKNKPVRIIGTTIDITQRKKQQDELRNSESLYRSLFNNMQNGFIYNEILLDDHKKPFDFKIIEANKAFNSMFELPYKDVSEMNFCGLLPKFDDFENDWLKQFANVALKGREARFEQYIPHLNKWLSITAFATKKRFFAVLFIDITERKQSIQELLSYHERLVEAQRIASIGNWEYNVIDQKVTWSDETYSLLARNKELGNPSYKEMLALMGVEAAIQVNEKNLKAIINGEPYDLDIKVIRENISVYLNLTARVILNEEGKVTRLVGTIQDITDRKINEEELIKAKEKAEEADKLKSAFLANMSHEIRTPMNGILGFASLLKLPDLSDEKKGKYIDLINSNGQSLLALIEDIIDIAKIESDRLSIKKSAFHLEHMLDDLYITFSELIKNQKQDNSIQLNKNYANLDEIVVTDGYRLRQIFMNLLGNAMKFTERGTIEYGYTLEEKEAGEVFLQFYVKDTGIGIEKNKLVLIFERFRQVDDSYSRKYGGAGLGLTICKNLVKMLGGQMWCESEFGKGSTFYFTLPFILGDQYQKL